MHKIWQLHEWDSHITDKRFDFKGNVVSWGTQMIILLT